MREVPIRKLPAQLPEPCRYGDVAWQLEIPEYVPRPEDVVLDAAHLGFVSRMAGFSGIVIHGYKGKTSDVVGEPVGVVGLGSNGMGTGIGTAKQVKAESVRHKLHDEDKHTHHTYNWPVVEPHINKDELQNRVEQHSDKDITSAYAQELNGAMRTGMLLAARQNLLMPHSRDSNAINHLAGSFVVVDTLLSDHTWLLGVQVVMLGITTLANKLNHGESLIRRKRWSIFPYAVQPDRFAVAAAGLHSKPLVRNKQPNS